MKPKLTTILSRTLTILAIVILFIPLALYLGILAIFSSGKDYFATGDFDEDFTH
jgi:hypothetical protein